MGASTEAMIDQLQQQLALGPQNSLFGLTTPPDPSKLQALLGTLKQQQYQDQANQRTPGPYGYLHDAGNLQFNQVGQGLGQAIGGAIPLIAQQQQAAQGGGQPTPGQSGVNGPPTPATPANPATSIATMDKAAAAMNNALIAQGVPPDQAKVKVLTQLAQMGRPGAADALVQAQQDVLKNASTVSQTKKDNAQGDAATDEISHRATDDAMRQQQIGIDQQKADTEKARLALDQSKQANLSDPASIQFMADTYRTTGKMPASIGRSPALQMAVMNRVAQDSLTNGDTAGSINARSMALKAGSAALDQTQKQEAATGTAVATLDKNINVLDQLADARFASGSPLMNKVINHWNQGVTNDPQTASLVTMMNAVQGEYAKIASNNNGNSPVSDSAKADAKDVINKAFSTGGIHAVTDTMRQESQNRMSSIRDTKNGLIQQLGTNAPGVQVPASPAPAAPATPPVAAKVPTYNPKTGKIE
jgi:hypothetical protein